MLCYFFHLFDGNLGRILLTKPPNADMDLALLAFSTLQLRTNVPLGAISINMLENIAPLSRQMH